MMGDKYSFTLLGNRATGGHVEPTNRFISFVRTPESVDEPLLQEGENQPLLSEETEPPFLPVVEEGLFFPEIEEQLLLPKVVARPLLPEIREQPLLRAVEEQISEVPAYETPNEMDHDSLTMKGAAILIVGMAGNGLLALPYALANIGWIGVPLMIFICGIVAYNGFCIGECWSMLEGRHPQLRDKIRNPYSLIAYHAMGPYGRLLAVVCMKLNLLGTSIVYLLLAAQIIRELLEELAPSVSLCIWFFIIVLFVTPLMWFGTPKDLTFAGIAASMAIVLATILMLVQIGKDSEKQPESGHTKLHSFREFFLGFGSILFAFGGAPAFPTIQNDMRNKQKFSQSVIMAYSAVLVLYLALSISAYLVYGNSLPRNIVQSMSPTVYLVVANVLMALHLIFAFLIIINPVCQGIEKIFQIPHEFNWKRCLIRSVLMIALLLIGVTIPTCSIWISGSTIALLTFIVPAYFYMKICDQEEFFHVYPIYSIPLYKRIILWESIIVGVVGCTATIYTVFVFIFQANLQIMPCFIPK